MKKDIHPEAYRKVIFHDTSSGERFLIGSTVTSSGKDVWKDGKEYPLVQVEVSSASHPFYTGQEKMIDSAGRVEKFKARAAHSKRDSKLAKKGK
ncbi:MAG TPA: type B 50S ribosomal protein L31 [Candidatus Paceibacterota bacterium]|jgi:large subunit ribosomal protein L31